MLAIKNGWCMVRPGICVCKLSKMDGDEGLGTQMTKMNTI